MGNACHWWLCIRSVRSQWTEKRSPNGEIAVGDLTPYLLLYNSDCVAQHINIKTLLWGLNILLFLKTTQRCQDSNLKSGCDLNFLHRVSPAPLNLFLISEGHKQKCMWTQLEKRNVHWVEWQMFVWFVFKCNKMAAWLQMFSSYSCTTVQVNVFFAAVTLSSFIFDLSFIGLNQPTDWRQLDGSTTKQWNVWYN